MPKAIPQANGSPTKYPQRTTGRPPGKPTSRMTIITRRLAENWVGDGHIEPLMVGLTNMEYFHQRHRDLIHTLLMATPFAVRKDAPDEELYDALLKAWSFAGKARDADDFEHRLNTLNQVMTFRLQAQKCANDVMDLVHPRLRSVDFKGNGGKPFSIVISSGDENL